MEAIIIIAILFIVGGALAYIIKEKKKGKKCIGCPNGANCSSCGVVSCPHVDKKGNNDA